MPADRALGSLAGALGGALLLGVVDSRVLSMLLAAVFAVSAIRLFGAKPRPARAA